MMRGKGIATSFRLTWVVGLKPSCFLADLSKNSLVTAVVDIGTTSQETLFEGEEVGREMRRSSRLRVSHINWRAHGHYISNHGFHKLLTPQARRPCGSGLHSRCILGLTNGSAMTFRKTVQNSWIIVNQEVQHRVRSSEIENTGTMETTRTPQHPSRPDWSPPRGHPRDLPSANHQKALTTARPDQGMRLDSSRALP
jgi:hypothetical protein